MQTYENAKQICASQEVGNPSLIQINSLEEQLFIEKILFDDNKIIENVWLGARLDTKTHKFHWEGKTEPITNYENWAQLKNNTDYECVEMIPDGNDKGKWINTSCKKRNIVVCQKKQVWSLERLQEEFLNMKQDYELQITKLKKGLKDVFNSTAQIRSNPIPIDFIYVQLPSQPEPKTLWPMVEWKDVTLDYAGLFFRAEGGSAEPFGKLQNENSPRVVKVQRHDYFLANTSYEISLYPGGLSQYIYTGTGYKRDIDNIDIYHRFEVSGGEVRPQNKAVRIWKRTK